MTKKIALIMALCLTLCISLCACGSKDSDASLDITGSWTISSIVDAEGTSYTLEEYCSANGLDSAGMEITYTFNSDGTGTADIGGIGTELTYTVDGNVVTITVTETGQTTALTYEDNSLYSEDASSGMKTILTK